MASLKEMRNRIAKRESHAEDHEGDADGGGGQAAPRAGRRPERAALRRAHGRGDRQPGGRRLRRRRARSCWSAPARDQRHLVVVATSDRGLAGGFNSSIVRAARERIAACSAEGKDVRVLTRRPQGPRPAAPPLRRPLGRQPSRPAATRRLAVAQEVADKILELFEAGEVDVVTLFYSRFKSVVTQTPTAKQLIPAEVAGRRRADRPEGRGLRVRARRGDHPRGRCCRATSPPRSSPPCWRTRPASSPPR